MKGGGRIAYFAHLGGFFSGAILAVLLLKLKLVTMYRGEQSLVGLYDEWKQNRQDAKLERIARASIQIAEQTASPEESRAAAPEAMPAHIHFVCQCGQQFKMSIQHAGRKGRCPKCRQPITVPMADTADSV